MIKLLSGGITDPQVFPGIMLILWYYITRDRYVKSFWRFWSPNRRFYCATLERCNFADTWPNPKNPGTRPIYRPSATQWYHRQDTPASLHPPCDRTGDRTRDRTCARTYKFREDFNNFFSIPEGPATHRMCSEWSQDIPPDKSSVSDFLDRLSFSRNGG